MTVPTSSYRAAALPDIAQLLLKLPAAMILLNISYTSEASPLMRMPRNPEMDDITPNLLNTTKYYHCYIDVSNSDFSTSEGNDSFFCQPGEHITSDDDPCPGSQRCCQCKPGTFLPKENNCGTCIPHTECDEIEISGDGLRDNVCVKTQSEDSQDVTTDSSRLTHPPDTGTEEVDTGQVIATDPSRSIHPPDAGTKPDEEDTGQDEQDSGNSTGFSIPSPWSLILLIFMFVLVVVIVIMIAAVVQSRKGDSGNYARANRDDVEMGPMRSGGDRGTSVQREN